MLEKKKIEKNKQKTLLVCLVSHFRSHLDQNYTHTNKTKQLLQQMEEKSRSLPAEQQKGDSFVRFVYFSFIFKEIT